MISPWLRILLLAELWPSLRELGPMWDFRTSYCPLFPY